MLRRSKSSLKYIQRDEKPEPSKAFWPIVAPLVSSTSLKEWFTGPGRKVRACFSWCDRRLLGSGQAQISVSGQALLGFFDQPGCHSKHHRNEGMPGL